MVWHLSFVIRKILELCLRNGANLAEPGEFTKRAFLNGRIDLLQAESVIDIINSKSERELNTGIKQLEGILSKKIKDIKQAIVEKKQEIKAYVVTKDMKEFTLKLGDLTDDEREIITKGCLINYYRG